MTLGHEFVIPATHRVRDKLRRESRPLDSTTELLDARLRACVTTLLRHCEPFEFLRVNSPKGAWQSPYFQRIMRLPLGHEPLGLETCRRAQVESLGAERLEAEWLRSFLSLAMTLRHSLLRGHDVVVSIKLLVSLQL
jgi:hypothetical protein